MDDGGTLECGGMGRVAYARVAPNEDLVRSVEALCRLHGFRHAFVRGALGSLVDACLAGPRGGCTAVAGPAVEIVSLAGEVRPAPDGALRAALTGVVVDGAGRVYGGPFVAGANRVCVTLEVTLEEWLPDAPA